MRKIVYEDDNGCSMAVNIENAYLELTYDDESTIHMAYELSSEDIEDLILDLIEMKKQIDNE